MTTDAERRRAIQHAAEPTFEYGTLGNPTGTNTWEFEVRGRPQYVYVIYLKGEGSTLGDALNPNGVAHVGNLPVRIINDNGVRKIHDIDPARYEKFMNGNNAPIGASRHTHELGFGNEDFVSSKRLSPLRCRFTTGITIRVLEGHVVWQGVEYDWPTTDYTLTTEVAAITAGQWAWLKILIDPESVAIAANPSSSVADPTSLDLATLNAVSNVVSGTPYLPVAGIRMANGQTAQGKETDLVDIRSWVTGAVRARRTATGISYTMLPADVIVGVTSTASARTITLPAATAVKAGLPYYVKDESGGAGTNNITIQRAGSDTVDGATSVAITANYGAKALYSDGASKWFTL